jgi:mannose/fructose/N-acetylgalactosamine-specific phosphotransferase system component IIB
LDCVGIKTRNLRQANWENSKVITVINAKKAEHETSLEVVDSRNNMETTIKKWKHIFEVIMANLHFHHHCNKPTYKDKWGSLYGDYKKIHDYQNVTCHNAEY